MNRITLIGNLGADPRSQYIGDAKYCKFDIATTESYKDKEGEWQERTDWHRCIIWGKERVDYAMAHLLKGDKVYVDGSYRKRSYEDKDGVMRHVAEVVVSSYMVLKHSGTTHEPEHHLSNADDDLPF